MKRFFVVLGGLLMLPAFAEVAPVYYEEVVEYTDDVIDAVDDVDATENVATTQKNVTSRKTTNRTPTRTTNSTRSGASTRVPVETIRNSQRQANRATVSRTTKAPTPQTTAQRTTATRTAVSRSGGQSAGNMAIRARVGTGSNSVAPAWSTSDSGTRVMTVSDSGNALYIGGATSSDTSRIGTRRSVSVASRSSTSTTPVVTESDIATTTTNLDAITQLTEYCKAQYAACMDNYCNVLDDNQGRCSCSKNLKNYQKVEEALATATNEFQDAVQKIKYLGLTADQVTSLFQETEAELALKTNSDNSALKTSLDRIKDRVLLTPTTTSSSNAASGISTNIAGLLDFDLSSAFDLNSFLNMGLGTTNTDTVTNQRGEQLYKTAVSRCRTTVLNSCTAQGIEASVITNAYELEIDKHCIAYERSLNDANNEMRTNVRNASIILQQARLMLAQNKNSYGLRDCIAAIDSCMQDDYVCGADYELCLDPTGKYLANGEIIKGGTPGIPGGTVKNTKTICEDGQPSSSNCQSQNDWTSQGMYGLYSVWNYNSGGLNAFGGGLTENLGSYIDEKLKSWESGYDKTALVSNDMATYLLQKIGYMDKDDQAHGMCASVMKQCQNYTYSSASKTSKKYLPNNEVVRQYLASTLNKIKASQDAILSDYVEDCRNDVTACLSTNGYDESNTQTTASQTAVNACRSEIQTCMSVSGYQPSDSTTLSIRSMSEWVKTLLISCPQNYYLVETAASGNTTFSVSCQACEKKDGVQTESAGGQSTRCHCPDGYADVTNSAGELTGCTQITGD